MKRSELKEAIKAEIKSVLLEDQSKSAVHSLGKDLYDYLTNVVKMKGSLSSPIGGDSINSGQQFTVLINDNKGKFDRVTLRIPVGKDNINKEYIQKNIVDQVKRKYKELETKISQDNSSEGNRAIVDFTLTGPNLFQKVTEEIQVGDIVTLGGDGDELEVIDKREMFGSDMMAYRVKFPDGNTEEYSADQLRPTSMMHDDPGDIRIDHDYYTENLKEESRFPTQADIDDIENSGNIDIAYKKAMTLLKSLMNKSVSFSDLTGSPSNRFLREGTWSSGTYNEIGRFIQDVKNLKDKYYNIVGNDDVFDGLDRAEESAREMMIDAPENRSDLNEDEMSDEEKDKAASKGAKKKDSVATISNKLQKLTAKMKKKAKEFKEAEGKAKDKLKDELKDMTAEKKKLEKSL